MLISSANVPSDWGWDREVMELFDGINDPFGRGLSVASRRRSELWADHCRETYRGELGYE